MGLTRRIFATLFVGVFPSHRLEVTALTLLNIQLEQMEPPFSEEELALLIHGNPGFGKSIQLSLSDFMSLASPPEWIAPDKWEDILTYSVLPGGLESICVTIADDSESWRMWSNLKEPEAIEPPVTEKEGTPPLTKLQKLLLLKTLRPDRLEAGLQLYVKSELVENTPMSEVLSTKQPMDLKTLMKDVTNTLGILVLLPENTNTEGLSHLSMQPYDAIKHLAHLVKTNVESVIIGDGYEQEAGRCIEAALQQDCWALIHGLHLAPDKFFETLQTDLARVGNVSRLSESDPTDKVSLTTPDDVGSHHDKQRCLVWMTSQTYPGLPSMLTQYLYKISWDTLLRLVVQESESKTLIAIDPEITTFKATLMSTISKVPDELTDSWSESSNPSLLYGLCICHTVLMVRQCVGWLGNSMFYSLNQSILCHALAHALSERNLHLMLPVLNNFYCDIISNESDQKYTMNLLNDIMRQVAPTQDGRPTVVININDVEIPVPGKDIHPKTIPSWIEANLSNNIELTSILAVPTCSKDWQIAQKGEVVLSEMQNLFNAIQKPGYEASLLSPGSDVVKSNVTLAALQNVIDICNDKLPPLLELGEVNHGKLTQFNFPYHTPSTLSVSKPEPHHMPESIGFVLLQECIWFNETVCVVLQQIHELHTQLFVTSDYKLSPKLKATALALEREEVPPEWQHPNLTPNSHVLLTWLENIGQRYKQCRAWVKGGMVPIDGKTPMGTLSRVWLGGLVNPTSLLISLCQEKAVLHDVTMDQVYVNCIVERSEGSVIEQDAGIYIDGCRIVNAQWSPTDGSLIQTSTNEFSTLLPSLYFYPTIVGKDEQVTKDESCIHVPVFVNMARKEVLCHLPLPSDTQISSYMDPSNGRKYAKDCYVILHETPELSCYDAYKSRAYLALKRREYLSRVSPSVTEIMSRSATRLSSRTAHSVAGPRVPKIFKPQSPPKQMHINDAILESGEVIDPPSLPSSRNMSPTPPGSFNGGSRGGSFTGSRGPPSFTESKGGPPSFAGSGYGGLPNEPLRTPPVVPLPNGDLVDGEGLFQQILEQKATDDDRSTNSFNTG